MCPLLPLDKNAKKSRITLELLKQNKHEKNFFIITDGPVVSGHQLC